jgi:spermidine synthase
VSPAILAALLVLSGAAALIYQALWVKQIGLLVGVAVYAVTTVVSAFFAGLAVGSGVLGRRADASPRPLALYAGLELGVGLTGLATTLLLSRLAGPYAALEDAMGRGAWGLPFVLIALPAFLMGGTLPALVRAARPNGGTIGAASGALYAANTAGGVLGVLATPLLLVPAFGVQGTGAVAATTNLVLAATAAMLARRAPSVSQRVAPAPAAEPDPRAAGGAAGSRLALTLYAIAGGLALGLEVAWVQAVMQFINTRAYAFALVLATYLTGLVVGSALWARLADRVQNPWRAFGLLEAGVGATALACFALLGPWLPALQTSAHDAVLAASGPVALAAGAQMVLAPIALLLVPTVLLGAAFPAAARLACGPENVGGDVGAVVALNTLGGIAGTLATGFVAVPAFGVSRTLTLLAVGATAVGGAAVLRGAVGRSRAVRWRTATAVALGVAAIAGAGALVPADHLARLLVLTRAGTLEAYEESPGGIIAVVRVPYFQSFFRRLYIQGISNSGDSMMSLRYMRLQMLLPLLLHQGDARSVLVVGLGTGITCGTSLAWPSLERRVCAELLPAVVRTVGRFEGNLGVATDPRATIRVVDGRHLLLQDPTLWDIITLEPPPPTAAGVVNLYSRDFYELCRERLAPGGIMAQWFPLSTQNEEDARALVRSFLDVFPHVSLWTTEAHETLLVGSREPLVIDARTLAARFAQPEVRRILGEVGIADPAALLATYVTDRAGLEAFVAGAPPVTDDRPRLEYAGIVRSGEFSRVLADILALQREPPLVGADDDLRAAIATSRRNLHAFYEAVRLFHAGRRDDVEPYLRRVFDAEGSNPYYRWFVGSSG